MNTENVAIEMPKSIALHFAAKCLQNPNVIELISSDEANAAYEKFPIPVQTFRRYFDNSTEKANATVNVGTIAAIHEVTKESTEDNTVLSSLVIANNRAAINFFINSNHATQDEYPGFVLVAQTRFTKETGKNQVIRFVIMSVEDYEAMMMQRATKKAEASARTAKPNNRFNKQPGKKVFNKNSKRR